MRVLLACALIVLASGAAAQRLPTGPPRPPATPTRPQPASKQPPIPKNRSATGDALERYERGEYERAVNVLLTVGGFDVESAGRWIWAAGPAAAERRRLVAATLALEVANVSDMWPTTVVEWACETLRLSGESTPAEALWLRASIALAEGQGMWVFLNGLESPGHLSHARARFPDNPYFKMAEVVVSEHAASPVSGPPSARSERTPVTADRLVADLLDAPADAKSDRAMRLQRAVTMLEPLLSDDALGAEAHLRLGYIQLRLGQPALAMQHFAAIDSAATDPFCTYLARVFAGWAHARAGRTSAAEASYRSALEVLPRSRSATTLLAALLIGQNRLADAESLVAEFLAAPSPQDKEPWLLYPLGDYRAYSSLIAQLREAIK